MTLADQPQTAGLHARVAAAFAPTDEARSAYLTELVKVGGVCRACGAGVQDSSLDEHPGVCGACTKRGVEPDPALVARLAAAAGIGSAPRPTPIVKTFVREIPAQVAPSKPEAPKEDTAMICPFCKVTKMKAGNTVACGKCQATNHAARMAVKAAKEKANGATAKAAPAAKALEERPRAPKRSRKAGPAPCRPALGRATHEIDGLEVEDLLYLRGYVDQALRNHLAEAKGAADEAHARADTIEKAIGASAP